MSQRHDRLALLDRYLRLATVSRQVTPAPRSAVASSLAISSWILAVCTPCATFADTVMTRLAATRLMKPTRGAATRSTKLLIGTEPEGVCTRSSSI